MFLRRRLRRSPLIRMWSRSLSGRDRAGSGRPVAAWAYRADGTDGLGDGAQEAHGTRPGYRGHPPENVFIPEYCTDLDNLDSCAIRYDKPKYQLIQDGYDPEVVANCPVRLASSTA